MTLIQFAAIPIISVGVIFSLAAIALCCAFVYEVFTANVKEATHSFICLTAYGIGSGVLLAIGAWIWGLA